VRSSDGPSGSSIYSSHVFKFSGDSYSSVGYDSSQVGIPSAPENPLGIKFPGHTWTEGPDTPNWVGWLISKYSKNPNLIAYDYAVGGDDVSGVREQIHEEFVPHIGGKPDWARWEESNTLFVIWVGINDCAYIRDEEPIRKAIDKLIKLQLDLYDVGARNFLLIDIPPINRSPAVQRLVDDGTPYTTWNTILRAKAKEFSVSHPETTILMFSAWDAFNRVLNWPTGYGFTDADARKAGGAIWSDALHPTSRMHDALAHDIAAFLHSVTAFTNPLQAEAEAV